MVPTLYADRDGAVAAAQFLNSFTEEQRENIRTLATSVSSQQIKFGLGERDPYPKNEQTDSLIANPHMRPWSEELDYDPTYFASDKEHTNHEWPNGFGYADPCGTFAEDGDLEKVKQAIREQIINGRNRLGGLEAVDDIGVNPNGRTGISGPGELGTYGPNKAADTFIFCFIDGKWQVLLTQRPKKDAWAAPGGMIDAKDGTSRHAHRRELLEETNVNYDELKKQNLITEIGIAYEGSTHDIRDTDHAWMTTTAYVNILDPKALKNIKLAPKDPEEVTGCCWVPITEILDGTRPLFANHTSMMSKAVQLVFEQAAQASSEITKVEG